MRDEFVLVTRGITATATGRTDLVETDLVETVGMRSQLRRSLSSVLRARMVLDRPCDVASLATRIGLEFLAMTPLTWCRRPLTGTTLLLTVATGLVPAFAICICGTGCARALVLGVRTGPEATVNTTPVAV